MPEKSATVAKDFSSAFILDRSKLSRILNILEERFTSAQLQFKPRYAVRLANDKRIDLASVDELFALDNAIRNPISSLTIKAVASENETKIESHISFNDGEIDNVDLRVTSSNSSLALQLFAELEEQLERTFLNNWVYRFFKERFSSIIMLLVTMIPLVIALFLVFLRGEQSLSESSSKLPDSIINELIQNSKTATRLEDKVNFLFDLNVKQLEAGQSQRPTINIQDFLNLKTLFVALPLIIVVGCASYAIARCYPIAVFLWGDYEERHARLVSTRNTLWIVVILSITLGIITNLFVIGLSDFIRIGS